MSDSAGDYNQPEPDSELSTAKGPVDEEPLVPWGWLRGSLFLLAYVLMTFVVSVAVVLTLGVTGETEFGALMGSVTGVIIVFATLVASVLLVWLFRIGLDRRSFKSLGFDLGSLGRNGLLAGMVWGVGLIGLVFSGLLSSGQIVAGPMTFPVESLLIQLAICTMVALTEEITMRGYLLSNMMQSANKYLALLLVSLLFAAFHGFNPNLSWVGVLNIVLAGLLLGIYYVHKRNLWFPIGLHFSWNLFQGAVFGSPVSGLEVEGIFSYELRGSELLTGGEFGFEASLLTTGLIVLSTLLIHLKYRVGVTKDSGALAPHNIDN